MYHKWQSYDVWFLRYGVQQTEFFIILDHFLPFYHPNNPKNQNFEKMKKPPVDIILHRCTINENHMKYGSWVTEHDRIFCHFGPYFALLNSNNPKNHNFEKMKNPSGICVPMVIWCMVPEIWNMTDKIFCHFGPFFCPFSP